MAVKQAMVPFFRKLTSRASCGPMCVAGHPDFQTNTARG